MHLVTAMCVREWIMLHYLRIGSLTTIMQSNTQNAEYAHAQGSDQVH